MFDVLPDDEIQFENDFIDTGNYYYVSAERIANEFPLPTYEEYMQYIESFKNGAKDMPLDMPRSEWPE